mmetsp:Transcript_11658/g.23205  ORF Transcript_11658/g.23205 Transcript_11658/m.23205 type:complete len:275 (-) Transcript_11658:967-1791(-)
MPAVFAIRTNRPNTTDAPGTSSLRSSRFSLERSKPLASCPSLVMEFLTRNSRRAHMAATSSSSPVSAAARMPRLMSSWWKRGSLISWTQHAASSSSRERRYSLSSWSMLSLRSGTLRPSPGPQTFSIRTEQCSRLSSLRAWSTAAPSLPTRNAGGSISSTTARAMNAPTAAVASGTSTASSRTDSHSRSNPACTSPGVSRSGRFRARRREVASRSRGPRSRLMPTARLTISAWYSPHPSSRVARTTSSASPESKNSRRASSVRRLNSGRVRAGP